MKELSFTQALLPRTDWPKSTPCPIRADFLLFLRKPPDLSMSSTVDSTGSTSTTPSLEVLRCLSATLPTAGVVAAISLRASPMLLLLLLSSISSWWSSPAHRRKRFLFFSSLLVDFTARSTTLPLFRWWWGEASVLWMISVRDPLRFLVLLMVESTEQIRDCVERCCPLLAVVVLVVVAPQSSVWFFPDASLSLLHTNGEITEGA